MATSQQALVRDASTLANYKAWGQAISNFFSTAGWIQSSDTGQVNWGTIATVPSNSITRDYEIWTPGDGLQVFYLKIQYGTGGSSGNTNPVIQVTLSTATNGAGTQTGFVTPSMRMPNADQSVSSTSVQWQCYFAGDSGRIGMLMWRDDGSNNGPICFVVQRSLNSSGVAYGTSTTGYVTLVAISYDNNRNCGQTHLVFNTGVFTPATPNSSNGRMSFLQCGGLGSQLFAGGIPISPIFPVVGFFDNPIDMLAIGASSDFTEGAQYSIASANMPYGVSHNYIAAKNSPFFQVGSNGNVSAVLMRFD
jgi:hypothetical protein